MASEIEALKSRAAELAELAHDRPESAQARRLAERLDTGGFRIAVVGEFKRGKSTLINALVGEAVLPTGVVPLTAVPTELSFGDTRATVVFLSGRSEDIGCEQIAAYVTESENPQNVLGVARVEVRGNWALLEPGAVLVDTPGIASLYEHNTEVGRASMLDADGAVVVLSADAPLSRQEHEMLQVLSDRQSPTFFVLNKCDHLHHDELVEVQRFVAGAIREVVGGRPIVFSVDALSALDSTASSGKRGSEFDALLAAL